MKSKLKAVEAVGRRGCRYRRSIVRWKPDFVEERPQRGEHETCYEMVKKFLAPTESKSFRLHLFYFCFATLAYGMWKLADFRAKKDLGIPLVDEEGWTTDSVVEFGEFLETLEDQLEIGGNSLHEPG